MLKFSDIYGLRFKKYKILMFKKLTISIFFNSRNKTAEARAEFAERSVQKLQKEVDRLEDELVSEKERYRGITDELDQTFSELSGY